MENRVSRTPSYSIGEVVERYPACSEYTKLERIPSIGEFAEFHLDIHTPSVLQANYQDGVATLNVNDKVMQIIKMKGDDLHDMLVPLRGEVVGLSILEIEDFESYVDDAALQAVWVPTGPLIGPTLYLGDPYEGLKSMTLQFKNNVGSKVTYSFTSDDWSSYESLNFWHASSSTVSGSSFRVRLGDSLGNFMYNSIPAGIFTYWHFHKVLFSNFTFESDPVDITDITTIEIVVENYEGNVSFEYFDKFTLDPALTGLLSLQTRIYYFGETEPISGTSLPSPLILDDGNTYVETDVFLNEQFRRISIQLAHKEHDPAEHLEIDHYYGIEYTNSNSNTIINLYGDNSEPYTDGKLFTVSSGQLQTDLEASSGLYFISHVTGYIERAELRFNDLPGKDSLLILTYKSVDGSTLCSPVILQIENDSLVYTFNFLETKQLFLIGENEYLNVIFQPSNSTRASSVEVYVKGRHKFGR